MKSYPKLIQSLDQLVTVYRHLLDIVRKENQVLVAADLVEVPIINQAKEKLVLKVRMLEKEWMSAADALAVELQMKESKPSLLEMTKYLQGEDSVKMEQLHSVLNLLVSRIAEINKKNAVLVKSALSHIGGAMDSITRTLNENPTYKKSGNMNGKNKDAQGRLVQREA